MVKLENAEILIKFQILLASSLLILGLALSHIKTYSYFKDCRGAGADILLLVDVAHPGWHDKMRLYSSALMERFRVGRREQMCRFMKVEYTGSPMNAVNMEFFQDDGGVVDNGSVKSLSSGVGSWNGKRDVGGKDGADYTLITMSQSTDDKQRSRTSESPTSPQQPQQKSHQLQQNQYQHIKFLIILTASEEVLTSDTEETVAKVASLNVTTIVASFDYIHKVPLDDLSSIASDSLYIFVAHQIHAGVLVDKIVNVVCRETKAHEIYNSRRGLNDVTYDCVDANPCSLKLLQHNVYTFPHWNPSKFVLCHGVSRCVIRDCVYGSLWHESTRLCY